MAKDLCEFFAGDHSRETMKGSRVIALPRKAARTVAAFVVRFAVRRAAVARDPEKHRLASRLSMRRWYAKKKLRKAPCIPFWQRHKVKEIIPDEPPPLSAILLARPSLEQSQQAIAHSGIRRRKPRRVAPSRS